MRTFFSEVIGLITDSIIIIIMMLMLLSMLLFMIHDMRLQHAQHGLTRQVNVTSGEMSKTGDSGNLRYGEPFITTGSRVYNFFNTPINLREARSGVNRGKFTTEGYVYK